MSAQDEGAAVAGYWEAEQAREAMTVVRWKEDLSTGMIQVQMADGSIKVVDEVEARQILPFNCATRRFMRYP